METLLEGLQLLNYADFAHKLQLPLLHRHYFLLQHNTHEQFYYFTALSSWILNILGVKFETPGKFDDPNATAAAIVIELRNLNLQCDLTVSKLRVGFGEPVVAVLQALVDLALHKKGIKFNKPVFKQEEVIEEAEVDEDAEIVPDEVASDAESEEIFFKDSKKEEKSAPAVSKEQKIEEAKIKDPHEWALEVERVAPLLKIQLDHDHKDWRLHQQQLKGYIQELQSTHGNTGKMMNKVYDEVVKSLEKITSREKYVASHFDEQTNEHIDLQDRLSKIKHEYHSANTIITDLSNELSTVSDSLETSKAKMDEIGSGMTDAKPLVNIKQGLSKLKAEIKQMELRTGVIEHSLLHGKLSHKRFYFGVDKAGGLVAANQAE